MFHPTCCVNLIFPGPASEADFLRSYQVGSAVAYKSGPFDQVCAYLCEYNTSNGIVLPNHSIALNPWTSPTLFKCATRLAHSLLTKRPSLRPRHSTHLIAISSSADHRGLARLHSCLWWPPTSIAMHELKTVSFHRQSCLTSSPSMTGSS